MISGSGAGAETIQSLGHVLQIPRLPTGKEVKKPWFLAAFFGYFLSLVKESNPPEAGHADLCANAKQKQITSQTDRSGNDTPGS